MKNKDDIKYLNSVSSAMVEKTPRSTKVILYLMFLLVIAFGVWAYYAKVEQLVRGEFKVIPYGQNQLVQNFEGGVITDILVEEGDFVKKGEVLLKLKNTQYSSTYEKNIFEIEDLKAQKQRLYAQANDKKFVLEVGANESLKEQHLLYKSNLRQLESKQRVLKEQLSQKKREKNEIYSRIRHLKQSFNLILKEQKVMDPLVKKGIVSKVEYLKLLREANSIKEELESTKLSLSITSSAVKEYESRIKDAKVEFQNESQKEYNDVISKIELFSKKNKGLKDQVQRTVVTSPVNGLIKKMYVNTIGGSVQAAQNLVEIVPKDKELLLETKIKPEDIAFVYEGQNSTLKFTAYDFSIYGSLDGKIEKISPDSVTDKEKNSYYLVYIKTNRDYLGIEEKPLYIKPGMRGSADIITGQRSVWKYLLKPIIKTKQYAFTEK